MQAGRLRERVTLQRQEVTRNGVGEECIEWVDVQTVWAQVQATRGAREGFVGRSDQVQAKADHQVTVRRWDALDPDVKHRLKWGKRLLDIQNVIPDPQHRQWVLMCEAVI